MKYRMKYLLALCLLTIITGPAFSQGKPVTYDLFRLATDKKLQVINRDVSPLVDGSKKGLHLSAKDDDGVAWIDGVNFANGIIEFDARGKDVLQKSFLGLAFHGINQKELEVVYFRPFNFRSTDSVRRIHAVQYAFHPDYPWPRLREEFNAQYEKEINPAPDPKEWFHVKIVADYPAISVYVNNQAKPCITIKQLSPHKSGKLGLWVGNGSDGDFANLAVINK